MYKILSDSSYDYEELLTSKDIINLLKISSSTFYRLLSAGKLPQPSISFTNKTKRWTKKDLDDYFYDISKLKDQDEADLSEFV